MRMRHRTMRPGLVGIAAILLGAIVPIGGRAHAGITGIVSFGDSLSDVGNDAIGSGGAVPGMPDYADGRFSNGPIWLDYLARDLGLPAPQPFLAGTGGMNFAFGGAETGDGYSTFEGSSIPNIGTQIAMYLTDNTPTATELFTIWGGANDAIFGTSPNPYASVANIGQEITTLADAGAKQFLVPNLPPLNETPLAIAQGAVAAQALATFTQDFNQALAAEVNTLSNTLGVSIVLLDVNSLFSSVIANPSAYGFTDVMDPALNPASPDFAAGNGYLFWDDLHPTTQAGEILGNFAAQAVPEPSSVILLGTATGGLAFGLARASRRRRGRAAPR